MPLFPTEKIFEPAKALPDPPFVSVAAIISQLEERSKTVNYSENQTPASSKTDAMAPTHRLRKPTIPSATTSSLSLHGMERYAHPRTIDQKALLEKDLPQLPPEAESHFKWPCEHSRSPAPTWSEFDEPSGLQQFTSGSTTNTESRSVNHTMPVLPKDEVFSRSLEHTTFRGVIPEPSPTLTPTSLTTATLSSPFPTPPSAPNYLNYPLTPPTPLSPLDRQLLEHELACGSDFRHSLSYSPAPPTEYSRSPSAATLQETERDAVGDAREDGRVFSTHLNIATLEAAGVRPADGDGSLRTSSVYAEFKANASFLDDEDWVDEDETENETNPSINVLSPEYHQELVDEYRKLATPSLDVWKEPGSSEEDVSGNLRLVPRPLFWDQPRSVQHTRLMGQPKPNSPPKQIMPRRSRGHESQSTVGRSKQTRAVQSKRASAAFSGRPQSKYSKPARHKSIKIRASIPRDEYNYKNITVTTTYPRSPDYALNQVSPTSDSFSGSFWDLIKASTTRSGKKASALTSGTPTSPISTNGHAQSPAYTYVTALHAKPKRIRIAPPRINTTAIANAFNSVVSSMSPHSRTSSGESKFSKRQSKETRSSSEKKDSGQLSVETAKTSLDRKSKFPNLFGMVSEKAENREREKRKAELKKKIQYVNVVDPNDQKNYQVRPPTGGWI